MLPPTPPHHNHSATANPGLNTLLENVHTLYKTVLRDFTAGVSQNRIDINCFPKTYSHKFLRPYFKSHPVRSGELGVLIALAEDLSSIPSSQLSSSQAPVLGDPSSALHCIYMHVHIHTHTHTHTHIYIYIYIYT
jgi:hypothetical protein